jgi:ABC-type transporter Mla subunit MlaD
MSGWAEAFVVVAAVAIVIQMGILLSMFLQMQKAIQNFTRIATDLQSRVDPILHRVSRILDDSEGRIASIMSDASEMTRLARGQAQKIDRIFTDTVERLRIQVVRADQILTGVLEVVEDAGSRVRKTVWGPLSQVSAVLKGFKAGLDFIRGQQGRRRAEREATTQDEELFI